MHTTNTLSQSIPFVQHRHVLHYVIVVYIISMGFVPKHVPNNVFSLHTRRGAEECYERVQFPQCGGLLYSEVRDWETVAAQFLSRGGFSF